MDNEERMMQGKKLEFALEMLEELKEIKKELVKIRQKLR